jgi:hypothetical protein
VAALCLVLPHHLAWPTPDKRFNTSAPHPSSAHTAGGGGALADVSISVCDAESSTRDGMSSIPDVRVTDLCGNHGRAEPRSEAQSGCNASGSCSSVPSLEARNAYSPRPDVRTIRIHFWEDTPSLTGRQHNRQALRLDLMVGPSSSAGAGVGAEAEGVPCVLVSEEGSSSAESAVGLLGCSA